MKTPAFVKNQGSLCPSEEIQEHSPPKEVLFHNPKWTQKRFLKSMFLSENFYITAINIIEQTLEQIIHDDGLLRTQTMKLNDFIVETDTEEEQERIKDSVLQVLSDIGASENAFDRYPDTTDESREIKINTLLIRKLKLAAYKQQLLQVISWSHNYTTPHEKMLQITTGKLAELGCTHAYIEKLIKSIKNIPKN